MTAVDAMPRGDSHLDNARSGQDSTVARSGRSNVGIGQQARAAMRTAADQSTRANAYEDALGLTFCQLFSPAATRSPTVHTPTRGQKTDLEVGEDPEALYFLAAALVAGPPGAQAASLLHRLDTLTAQRSDRPPWRRRVEFLRATHAERTADSAAVLAHCEAANQIKHSSLSGDSRPTQNHDCFLQTVDAVISNQLPLLAIRAHIRLGQSQLAQTLLESRFGSQGRAESRQPATVALLACQQGRLNDARRLATVAIQTAATLGWPTELLELHALQVLAQVCFERNELDTAQGHLETALRHSWSSGATPYTWMVEADLLRVMIARQQAAGALHRLHTLRGAIGAEPVSRPLALTLNQAELEARLSLGDLGGALELFYSLPASELPWDAAVRLDLSVGRPDRALTRLGSGPVSGLAAEIRQLVLRACAERQEGRGPRAQDTMRRASEMARPDHYVRPFLETPTLTAALLRGLLDSRPDPYLSELLSQAEQLAAPTPARISVDILEPLTQRERQVLGQLSSHRNLSQIGAVMGLSTNTIKTHVKSVYRKTGAACRDDAVTVARNHGLL